MYSCISINIYIAKVTELCCTFEDVYISNSTQSILPAMVFVIPVSGLNTVHLMCSNSNPQVFNVILSLLSTPLLSYTLVLKAAILIFLHEISLKFL